MCLRVDAKGSGCGKGTHVSVFVFLMKGENDHQVPWPFEHDVRYRILNWKKDEDHAINTADFKNSSTPCKQRVTSQERATSGWGKSQLLPLSYLSDGAAEDTQYLHNDCLCVQVLKVEPPK